MKYILILAVIGVLLLAGCQTATQTTTQVPSTNINNQGPVTKTFVITGENFKFLTDGKESPELRVKPGDKVKIEFSSTSGFHDWVLDEFNAKTERVNTGQSTSVEFIADKKGTYEYYCSVGEHRAMGMKGNFIVE